MKVKGKYMINVVFITVLVVFLIYLQKSTNKFEEHLLLESKFAIGSFENFGYGYKAGGRNYKYSYFNEDDGKTRFKTGQRKMPNSEQRSMLKNGDMFLVLYNKEGESIFFDKPIKDSSDFKRYINEFEELRKKKK